jgi:hypothetical protein
MPALRDSRGAVAALLETLLGCTHDFYRAPVTRCFQHLAIGSRAVAETYGVVPDFESPAYLQRFDRPLLRSEVREELQETAERGLVRIALYSARPSRSPVEVDQPATGYSPEVEMARSLVGLDPWPIIGRGKMRWLARRTGDDVERLAKPSPAQALAAIGAAWSGQEASALRAAFAFHRHGQLRPPLAGIGTVTLHVFEDTIAGLASVERGIEALQEAGVTIAWRPYGIAASQTPKANAIAARSVQVYPSINEAVLSALAWVCEPQQEI